MTKLFKLAPSFYNMPKKSISSLELAALVNELQFLVNGKVSQIYHQEKNQLLLQLHAPGKGKQLLKIIPGKLLCLTALKNAPLRPSGFCMQLRKYINNSIIRNLYQKNSERAVILELEKEQKYFLIIELFSKGNIILTDDLFVIITALEHQQWKDRIIKPKEKYIFPPLEVNWKELTEKQLQDILKKSEKRNLATSLATEVGLGGLYAEEVCKINNINFTKEPAEITAKEIKAIAATIKDLLKKVQHPRGLVYEKEITPFPLVDQKPLRETATYNEAIDALNPLEIPSPHETKIKTLQRTSEGQKESIAALEESIALNARKGELMYENYAPLQKMLDIVKELKKTKSWEEVAQELRKEKKIRNVDLKNKKIVIDLP